MIVTNVKKYRCISDVHYNNFMNHMWYNHMETIVDYGNPQISFKIVNVMNSFIAII